ncbi:subtilisin inhibitor [Choanephora cucurbitarum]|nr:subtilisin inhibitor [Choanephora cucurbitarum]
MFKSALCLVASFVLLVSAAPATNDVLTISSTAQNVKYTLSCSPVGGNHPHRQEACNALKKCGGNLNAITPSTVPCPALYAPVTVTIEGTYGGKPVQLKKEYSNACTAQAQLGSIARL